MFWFSGWKMCGIFAPWLGTEPIPNALEDKVLTTGPPGKSLGVRIFLAWIPINLYIATGSNKKKKWQKGPWQHLLHAKYFAWGFPSGAVVKNPPANVRNIRDTSREDPLEKEMAIYLPGESHGQRSLAGCNPWGHKEADMTELLNTNTLSTFPYLILTTTQWGSWRLCIPILQLRNSEAQRVEVVSEVIQLTKRKSQQLTLDLNHCCVYSDLPEKAIPKKRLG